MSQPFSDDVEKYEASGTGPEARRREIAGLGYWFHNLHLPDGTQTRPDHHFGDFPRWKWQQIADGIPADLAGWSVLDIGCNAGFYSFEVARRGALVTGIDINPMYLEQARWAARELGLEDRVRFEQRHVYDLAHGPETYDLVLFLGVFYHLRHPLLGLDIAAAKARRLMVFQTLCLPGEEVLPAAQHDLEFQSLDLPNHPGWPKMAFVEGTFCKDPTNWWFANHAAALAMLRSAGLRLVERPASDIYLCAPDPERRKAEWELDEYRAATRT